VKKIVLLLVTVLSICSLFAGIGFDVSYYIPADPNTGVMWNFDYVREIDERVELNFSASYYWRDTPYNKRAETMPGYSSGSNASSSDFVTTGYMPFLLGIRAKIANINNIVPFAGGGVGWGFAWDSVQSVNEEANGTHFFGGLAWQLNAGASYALGSRSDLYAKFFYNGSNWKSGTENSGDSLHWNELNMSGFGMGLGIRLNY